MTLREALKVQEKDVEETIQDMVQQVEDGRDPEEVLFDEGLEGDYVMDLLTECE